MDVAGDNSNERGAALVSLCWENEKAFEPQHGVSRYDLSNERDSRDGMFLKGWSYGFSKSESREGKTADLFLSCTWEIGGGAMCVCLERVMAALG